MIEYYYFGQAKVFSQDSPGKYTWWGDFSKLTLGMEVDQKVRHKESFSGRRGTVRKFDVGYTMMLNGTLHQLDTTALARFMRASITTVAAGAVANEVLPTGLVAGDIIALANPGVSALTIVDSAGSPATYPAASYIADPRGSIEIVAPPTGLTEPLKASYTRAGHKQVAFLNTIPADIPVRVEALNLAEGGKPVVFELYKVSTSVLKELSMITEGTDVAGTEVETEALIDTSKPFGGTLGQFGRMLQGL